MKLHEVINRYRCGLASCLRLFVPVLRYQDGPARLLNRRLCYLVHPSSCL